MKANKTIRGQEVSNHRRKDKESESSTDSAAHNQTNNKTKWQESPHTYEY
jgi:hypothetical protein